MKRTVEITLSIIGAITALFGIIIFSSIKKFFLMEDMVNEIIEDINTDLVADGLDPMDASTLIDSSSVFFNIVVVIFVTVMILAIIAAILFTKNNKPKMASIILIIAAVIVTIGSIGTGLITGILLLIAGIMGLVRKPKTDDLLDDSYDDTDYSINE